MTYFRLEDACSPARSSVRGTGRTASAVLKKSAEETPASARFDIFLCHSFRDAELAWGAAQLLQQTGLTIYVDWMIDAQIDRTRVTPQTADILRSRMRRCDSLVYASSP